MIPLATMRMLRTLTRNLSAPAAGAALAACAILLAAHTASADDWKLKDSNGVSHTLAGQKGKWVLVNFWAPWCPPCLEEMPGFSALQEKHRDLQVIGIAVMYRKKREVLDMAKEKKLSYPVVLGNESIASEFGELTGLPVSFLYDPAGKLVGRHDGPLTPQQIEQAMARAPGATALFARGN